MALPIRRSIAGDPLWRRRSAARRHVPTWCSERGERFYAPETRGFTLCFSIWIVHRPLPSWLESLPLEEAYCPGILRLEFTPILGISCGFKGREGVVVNSGWLEGEEGADPKISVQFLEERPSGFEDRGGGRRGDPQCPRAPTVPPERIHLCQAPQ